MGRRGPKPKAPSAGDSYKTKARQRAVTEGEPTSAPKKPTWLRARGGFASRHFDQLVRLLKATPGRLAETDADAIAAYCLLWESFVEAKDIGTRTKVHPALDRAAKSLGLTPADRGRFRQPAPVEEASSLDSFLGGAS